MSTRTKVGRVISRRNLDKLRAIRDALQDILDNARADLDASADTGPPVAQKAVVLKRSADGRRYVGLITSNAYRDRDDEIVSLAALKAWVDEQWQGDAYIGKSTLLFWHDGPPIGDVLFSDLAGAFLVEVAKERDTPYAKAIFDMIERVDIPWGVSQGFMYRPGEKATGVYRRIDKFESSILPLDMAANPFTYAEVKSMSKKRSTFLNKHAPEAVALADNLATAAATATEKLDEAGVERKAVDAVEQKAVDAMALAEALASMVSEIMGQETPADLQERILTVIEDLDGGASDASAGDGSWKASPDPDEDEETEEVEDEDADARVRAKQVQLLETLMDDLEVLDDVAQQLKALAGLKALPDAVTALEKRLKRVEVRLSGGPRAASADEESEVEEDDPLGAKIKQQGTSDRVKKMFPDLLTTP